MAAQSLSRINNFRWVHLIFSARFFWAFAFVYACFSALLLQKLILPLLPELHAGNGLLHNDAVVFHAMAVEAAERIRTLGWEQWRLLPNAAGNVGLLSALYALFSPDPAWFIPFNAAAHATGALMIYLIGPLLWPGRVGAVGGITAGFLFLVFPSALQWYGQNHKDAFAIAGALAMLYASLRLYAGQCSPRVVWTSAVTMFFGALLLAAVRPYFPVLVLIAFVFAWLFVVLQILVQRRIRENREMLFGTALLIAVLSGVAFGSAQTSQALGTYGESNASHMYIQSAGWRWKESEWAPLVVEKAFRRASELRAHFVGFGKSVGAGSSIDEDRLPENSMEVLGYMPRAFIVGFFAPFPASWSERVSIPRLVGAIETAIWYLFFFGVVVLAFRRPSRALFAGFVFVATLVVVLSYVHPNVGTLYRQRFGFWMFMLLCGATGWASVIVPWLSRRSSEYGGGLQKVPDVAAGALPNSIGGGSRSSGLDTVVASGAVVAVITLLCYLGFITRDLLMLNLLGLNARLDGFFTAAMLPMFFVTFLAMPIADALMRSFVELSSTKGLMKANQMVQNVLWYGAVGLGFVAIFLIAAADPLTRFLLPQATDEALYDAAMMLRCFSPLVFVSAWTVIGSAILNGLRESRAAALAQLVVPIVTVVLMLVSPIEYGSYPAIFGMVIGTLGNAWIVGVRLRRFGVSLWPVRDSNNDIPVAIFATYRLMATAAFFSALAAPVSYTLAGYTGDGGVSSWALSNKIVVLFNGLVTVGVASVVLPHLARLVYSSHKDLRNDIYFLLIAGTWIGGVMAVMVFIFSAPLVSALFSGSDVSDAQVKNLIYMMRLGAVQLPMVVVAAVVMKMAAVAGVSTKVLYSSTLGLALNLAASLLLIDRLGVVGIAIGALLACAFATVYLTVTVRKECGFDLNEVFVLVLGWIVWGGICLSAVAESGAAVFCAVLGLLGLVWLQNRVWKNALVRTSFKGSRDEASV